MKKQFKILKKGELNWGKPILVIYNNKNENLQISSTGNIHIFEVNLFVFCF